MRRAWRGICAPRYWEWGAKHPGPDPINRLLTARLAKQMVSIPVRGDIFRAARRRRTACAGLSRRRLFL